MSIREKPIFSNSRVFSEKPPKFAFFGANLISTPPPPQQYATIEVQFFQNIFNILGKTPYLPHVQISAFLYTSKKERGF